MTSYICTSTYRPSTSILWHSSLIRKAKVRFKVEPSPTSVNGKVVLLSMVSMYVNTDITVDIYVSPYLSSYRTRRPRGFSPLPSTLHALVRKLVLPHENTQTIYPVCFGMGGALLGSCGLGSLLANHNSRLFKLRLNKQYRISNSKGPNSMPFVLLHNTIVRSCDFF